MFEPFLTTGIGSLPHTDPEEACTLVLETFDIPFWPQLPKLSFRESMIAQFSEGLPFLKIDDKHESLRVERNGNDLMRFYETYSEDTTLGISESYAAGLSAFRRKIGEKRFPYLKGHVTGPLTFTLGLKDAAGRLVYFDEELREISLMVLKAKVRMQAKTLQPHAGQVIIFIDEPILSALGSSAYIGVDPREALRLLKETTDAVKCAGAIAGIHCCSKADWPLVIDSGVSIISFDAYDYLETILLYPEEFNGFLRKGGYLAWGIVPTTESIRNENTDSIKRRFDASLALLSKSLPAEVLLSNILLSPSCGTGSMSKEETIKVFHLLAELKTRVKSTYR